MKSKSVKLGRLLGVTYGVFKDSFIKLLSDLEKKGRSTGAISPRKHLVSPEERRRWELKKLEFSVNYEEIKLE